MSVYSPDAYVARIKSGDVTPVILVVGEEQLLSDECVAQLIDASIDPSMREFNLDILDGSKMPVHEIVARAGSYPMMGDRRVVVVQHADRLGTSGDAKDPLSAYLEHPSETTRLILTAEKVDGRKKPFNDIKKSFDVVECKRMQDRYVPAWVQARAASIGKNIGVEAAALLQAYAGDSLLAVSQEIEKLATFVGARKDITPDDVAEAVGSTRGATVFDLQDACTRRDLKKATTIVRRMTLSGEQAPRLIASLAGHFSSLLGVVDGVKRKIPSGEIASKLGIHPYRVKLMTEAVRAYSEEELINAIHVLRESDRRVKTSQVSTAAELDLLLFRIIRGSRLGANVKL